jgi:hypothetical protein
MVQEANQIEAKPKADWLDQMENEIIPWVGKLIEKEQAHNDFLRNAKVELEFKRGTWFLPWKAETELNIDDISDMIAYSNSMMLHFETRQKEYIQFVKQERSKL